MGIPAARFRIGARRHEFLIETNPKGSAVDGNSNDELELRVFGTLRRTRTADSEVVGANKRGKAGEVDPGRRRERVQGWSLRLREEGERTGQVRFGAGKSGGCP
jgi:hypothetical protein